VALKSILLAFVLFSVGAQKDLPCKDLARWEVLLKHKVSPAVQNKLDLLAKKGNFKLQKLDEAGGKIINLDYFPVTIKNFPLNPETRKRFHAEGFLAYLRLHFNDFIKQKYARFSPSKRTGQDETALWNSDNPVGAVIHINIPMPAGDGSVICTEFSSNYWVYSTLKTPWKFFGDGNDGKHPVSGYRKVGYVRNADSSFTYYTMGVDRMSKKSQAFVAENTMKNPFKGADRLWESLRQGIYNFVAENGGTAVSLDSTPVLLYRDRWDEVKKCTLSNN